MQSGPGYAWFRGVIAGGPARRSSLSAGNPNMVKVNWLNGDPSENIDVSLEGTRILGQLEVPPPSIRTRQEEFNMHEAERSYDDPHAAARKWAASAVDLACAEAANIVISSAIDDAAVSVADAAAVVIAGSLRDHNRRSPLAAKWALYLHGGSLDSDFAAYHLRQATRAVELATTRTSRRKFPAEQLLSSTELAEVELSYPSAVSSQNDGSFGYSAARKVIAASSSLLASAGGLLRSGFQQHLHLSRLAVRSRAIQDKTLDAKDLTSEASSTPLLRPLQRLVHFMAAPISALAAEGHEGAASQFDIATSPEPEPPRPYLKSPLSRQTAKFPDRALKMNSLIATAARNYSSPHNTHPVFHGASNEVAGTLTASQQNRAQENWGILTSNRSAMISKDITAEKKNAELHGRLAFDRDNPDVRGFMSVTDNVGHGSRIRFETTTQHSRAFKYSELPPSVQSELVAAGEGAQQWASMVQSGLHTSGDLLASSNSDMLVRLNFMMTCKCVDNALETAVPCDLGPPPTRAATVQRKRRTPRISETDYRGVFENGMIQPQLLRMTLDALRSNGSAPCTTSIWDRGTRLHRQRPEPFAKVRLIPTTDLQYYNCGLKCSRPCLLCFLAGTF